MVQRIDEALLRKRSEHNNGELMTLKEVTLHQFDIERIENLEVYCKHLEILFLQNNQIMKIENLHKLKSLQYLNLALNNIKLIENLSACESLNKLDLTVNFIDDLSCVENLVDNYNLKQLYLVGNPCTDYFGYREFVIATLPQLQYLDGLFIEKSERIKAAQAYPGIKQLLDDGLLPKKEKNKEGKESNSGSQDDKKPFNLEDVTEHTPEARLEAAREMAKIKEEKEKPRNSQGPKPPKRERVLERNGEILQMNEGKYDFELSELDDRIELDISISKFLDTSFIDVDIHPSFVRVEIKKKMLQLRLEDGPICVEESTAKRSITTGHLLLSMPKVNPKITIAAKSKPLKFGGLATTEKINGELKGPIDYRNIVRADRISSKTRTENETILHDSTTAGAIEMVKKTKKVSKSTFKDNPDVPPLI